MTECIHELPTEQCTLCRPRVFLCGPRPPTERVTISARYASICPRCGEEIYPGQLITLLVADRQEALDGDVWMCDSCA